MCIGMIDDRLTRRLQKRWFKLRAWKLVLEREGKFFSEFTQFRWTDLFGVWVTDNNNKQLQEEPCRNRLQSPQSYEPGFHCFLHRGDAEKWLEHYDGTHDSFVIKPVLVDPRTITVAGVQETNSTSYVSVVVAKRIKMQHKTLGELVQEKMRHF